MAEEDTSLWDTTRSMAGGTVRYMAPELVKGDVAVVNRESDIWAFGMTCFVLSLLSILYPV